MTTRLNNQADPATGFWRHIRAVVPRPSARISYLGAVTLVGLVLFFTQAPQLGGNPFILAALIATELALSTMPVRIYGTTTVYVSYVVTLVIIAQFGPPGVVVLAPFDALRSHLANRRSVQTAIFNGGMHTTVYSSAAFAFGAISSTAPESIEAALFLGIAAATVTSVVVNALLITGRLFF